MPLTSKKNTAILFAILAAAFYALSAPASKYILATTTPTMMAAFLYLGAGSGMLLITLGRRITHTPNPADRLTRADLPYTIAMIVLDIAAPILLMLGIARTTAANASLLNNFEIVATSLIALVVFKEIISPRLWVAISLVTAASIILSLDITGGFHLDYGSLLVLGACVCWGIENNCTNRLATKSSEQIVMVKGIFSGLGSLTVALIITNPIPPIATILATMILGFVAYGLSINFYILAQKDLGAAKTSGYYAIAPFLGVLFSMVFLRELPAWNFWLALAIMAAATYLMIKDSIGLQHTHEHGHTHAHSHSHISGGKIITHNHKHTHHHVHAHTHAAGTDPNIHDHDHEFLHAEHSHDDHTHEHPELLGL